MFAEARMALILAMATFLSWAGLRSIATAERTAATTITMMAAYRNMYESLCIGQYLFQLKIN
jgi:hypothetical protein